MSEQSRPSLETSEESLRSIEQVDVWDDIFSSFDFQETELFKEEDLDIEPEQPQDLSETNWFILANQLRQQNQELIKTIVNLEQTLAEKQSPQRDLQIQEQQEKIVILTKQLSARQARIAELEKELTLLEQEQHNKNQQLLLAQKQIKELKTRLYRQQRYTLHYKAALNNSINESESATIEPWSKSLEIKEAHNIQPSPLVFVTEENSLKFPQINQSNQEMSPLIISSQPQSKKVDLPSFLIDGN